MPCEGAWFDWKYWDEEEWKPGNINVTCANGEERSDSDNNHVWLLAISWRTKFQKNDWT